MMTSLMRFSDRGDRARSDGNAAIRPVRCRASGLWGLPAYGPSVGGAAAGTERSIAAPARPSGPLGVDDGQALERGDLTEPLVGADEPVDRGHLVELDGDAELQGVEGANLPAKAVIRDQVPGAVVMDVEQAEDSVNPNWQCSHRVPQSLIISKVGT